MVDADENITPSPSGRQKGSFMVLALIAAVGLFAFVTPAAICKTLDKNALLKYSSDGLYDLRLSYSLGFTDNDITALQNDDCIDSVRSDPLRSDPAPQDNAITSVNVYPNLYVYIKDANEAGVLSDHYNDVINEAKDHIMTMIEPPLTAAREQAVRSELRHEIESLQDSLTESEEKTLELEDELDSLDKEYEKALADLDSEQEAIDEAKASIQKNIKNAQTTIENGKKDLTNVLNEVYGKSQVTTSDLKRAQGLSNYVSGSEKSLHEKFTDQWAELSGVETQLHEEQTSLAETREQREREISEEKDQLSQNKAETSEKIRLLQTKLDTESGRWILEDRSSIPSHAKLYAAYRNMHSCFSVIGIIIYALSVLACIFITYSIVSRNESRINSWQERGLEDRIIVSVFVRKAGVAAGIGSFIGILAGCILSPAAYMYSYTEIFDIPLSTLGMILLLPLTGFVTLITLVSLTVLFTFAFKIGGGNAGRTSYTGRSSGRKSKSSDTALKIDSLQDDLIQRFSDGGSDQFN